MNADRLKVDFDVTREDLAVLSRRAVMLQAVDASPYKFSYCHSLPATLRGPPGQAA
jgi:hypothetical protein